MRTRLQLVVALGSLLVAFILVFTATVAHRTEKELDDVREAAVRYLMPSSGAAYVQFKYSPGNSFVGKLVEKLLGHPAEAEDVDPDPAFLARLRSTGLQSLPASAMGAYGLLLWTEEPNRQSADKYTVPCGWSGGSLSSSFEELEITRTHGKWIVTKETITSQS
jgi:hypothetical protein